MTNSAVERSKGNKNGVCSPSYYVHTQVSDGIGPPVPNRDFSKTTEVIYDNKVTTETNEPSEFPDTNEETSSPANVKEEKSTVVEGDTKSENCVENDTYSSVKRS